MQTDAQKQVAAFFDGLSAKEIRRRQELCEAQLKIAHQQGNEKALGELRRMEADLTAAMLRRC